MGSYGLIQNKDLQGKSRCAKKRRLQFYSIPMLTAPKNSGSLTSMRKNEDANLRDQPIGKRIGDTKDLPDELKSQLNAYKTDELEDWIINTLNRRYEGIASLDEIIVGLYREYGYITKDRKYLNSKIYRMRNRNLLESVPKRKGVYRVLT